MVRAKFTVVRYEATQMQRRKDPKGNWESGNLETVEVRTVVLNVVGASSPENAQFWAASPSGEIKLGVVNPEAWQMFELGKSYYIDFSPAPETLGS